MSSVVTVPVYPTSPIGQVNQKFEAARALTKPKQAWNDSDHGALIVELQQQVMQLRSMVQSLESGKVGPQGPEGPQGPQGEPGNAADVTELQEQIKKNANAIDDMMQRLTFMGVPRDFVPVLNQEIVVNNAKHRVKTIPLKIRYHPITGKVEVFDDDGKVIDDDQYKPGVPVPLNLKLQP